MPKGITIVGLGPGAPGLLTIEAQQVLQAAGEIYVRTRRHPTVEALPQSATIHSFDEVYERANTFDEVYAEIASHVVELGKRPQGVVYAVPGHPCVGEASVQLILTLVKATDLPVRIVDGISFVEPVCTSLQLDPLIGLQIADATALATHHYPEFNPDLPVLIGQLYNRELAADVKLVLMVVYPDEHPITLICAAGTPAESLRTMPLYELDRYAEIDHLTSLYVPPLAQPSSVSAFQEVVARLRAPDGCPWDREQTHSSLRPFLLEETYEVLQALDRDDMELLKEELGDLLLQILLHTQIAIEGGEFKMADVVGHIVAKLKRRHPHVFGDVKVANSREVMVNWERIKSAERLALRRAEEAHPAQGKGDRQHEESALKDVPKAMPALARAQSLQRRAAHAGFDWPDVKSVSAKVEEEWKKLREDMAEEVRAAELGNLMFSLVALARWLDVDAESALREATARFERHFKDIERECAIRGQSLSDLKFQRDVLCKQPKKETG